MNHFAHLVLARPTIESTVGNLLGDFARGVDQAALAPAVRAGLHNHRAVDRYTDSHPRVQELKSLFTERRRRFAGIALDIYFDHLLIRHWHCFEQRDLREVIAGMYQRMQAGHNLMPGANMRRVTRRMIDHDWFGSYSDVDAIAKTLDHVAARIRFSNEFDNAIEDLLEHHEPIRDAFLAFYPDLKRHVAELALESCREALHKSFPAQGRDRL